ncbi:hypothetical protein IAT40_002558 [Kwoniella sp. CBS 6097]
MSTGTRSLVPGRLPHPPTASSPNDRRSVIHFTCKGSGSRCTETSAIEISSPSDIDDRIRSSIVQFEVTCRGCATDLSVSYPGYDPSTAAANTISGFRSDLKTAVVLPATNCIRKILDLGPGSSTQSHLACIATATGPHCATAYSGELECTNQLLKYDTKAGCLLPVQDRYQKLEVYPFNPNSTDDHLLPVQSFCPDEESILGPAPSSKPSKIGRFIKRPIKKAFGIGRSSKNHSSHTSSTHELSSRATEVFEAPDREIYEADSTPYLEAPTPTDVHGLPTHPKSSDTQ